MAMSRAFVDREQAGRALAERLLELQLQPPIVVLALPRGGVPIGLLVARALNAPLDLILVRKIGAPMQPELAVAAIVDGDPPDIVDDEENQALCGVSRDDVLVLAREEQRKNERRRSLYLGGRAPVPVQDATVVVVDDGIATGTTMRAALVALRRRRPARVVLAVPVAPAETLERLRTEVDDLVCLVQPSPFFAIGLHYDDFHQVDDDEVVTALDAAAAHMRAR